MRHLTRDPVWRAFFTCTLLGFAYGTLVTPLWNETVELGQVIAGTVTYEANNHWFYEIASSVTLFTLLPGLLLKAGFSLWALSVFFSGIICALSFAAAGLVVLLMTRSIVASAISPLLLLSYEFISHHYYPIFYPIYFFCFGQIGLFFCLLTLSLMALGKNRSAYFLLGVIPGVHISWAGATWIGFFAMLIVRHIKLERKTLIFFGLGLLITFSVFFLHSHLVHRTHPGPPLPPPSEATLPDRYPSKLELLQLWSRRDEAGNPTSHHLLLKEAPSPALETARYFYSEVVMALVLLIFFTTYRSLLDDRIKKFVVAIVFINLAALLLRVLDEYDRMAIFGIFAADLPYFFQRLIAGRWFNINVFLIPLIIGGILFRQSLRNKNLVAAIGMVALLLSVFNVPSWSLLPSDPFHRGFRWEICAILIGFITSGFASRLDFKNIQQRYVGAILLALLVILAAKPVFLTFQKTFIAKPFLGHDQFDELVESAKQNSDSIITTFVRGLDNFNPQLRTGRAVIVPVPAVLWGNPLYLYVPYNLNKKIYCMDILDPALLMNVMDKLKACFENRTLAEWQKIKHEFKASSVMTKKGWELKIPLVKSAGDISLYEIPDSQMDKPSN